MIRLTDILTYAWSVSRSVRLRILAGAVVGVLRIACGLLFIWLSKRLIGIATGDAEGALLPSSLWLILTVVVETVCSLWQGHLETATDARLKNALRHSLFVRVMGSCWDGRERFHTGDVVNRLEEDVRITAETICKTVPGTIVTLCQAIGAFLFLCLLSPVLGWIIAGILPLLLLAGKLYTRRMRHLTADIRTTDGRVQTLIQEHLQHRTLILGLMRTDSIAASLATLQGGLYNKVMRRNRLTQLTRLLMLTGFGAGYLTALLWGVAQLQHGAITFGVLTAFLQLVGQVQRPTADLSRLIPGVVHSLASLSRLAELEGLTPEKDDAATIARPFSGVRLTDVTFAYPDGSRDILHRLSHDFRPGTTSAIVGETGAGKSTMLRLILGMLQPQCGSVSLYGDDGIGQRASVSTRRSLVFVPQGNSLLSGTIRSNLLLANPQATHGEMREALHTAAADFVDHLPQGLDTPCGESGAGLSEGQAQRIAIARALLCSGRRILLLDEFSSALDTDTEHLLMERLTAHTAGKTMIFITHRQEIARRCQETIVLNKPN